ncbi:hypothetical protein [Streptomyces sp. NPDC014006]
MIPILLSVATVLGSCLLSGSAPTHDGEREHPAPPLLPRFLVLA